MAAPITDGVVRAAQAGEAAAFRVIYEELAPVVLGYLTAKGVADPEAVTSDVFLAALPRLRELSGGAAGLRTFVMSVAHARMVDDARRRRRQPVWYQYDVASDLRSAASAEHEAMELLGTARVVELLRDLPADQREVLVLRVVADLSVQEVATVIGRSPGAVKQLQHRAVRKLRQIVIEQGVTA
jgi:RNA polymerase sigma-70 factor (ECF subfamily)